MSDQLEPRPRREAMGASKAAWKIIDEAKLEALRQQSYAGLGKLVKRLVVDVDAERIALVQEHGVHINDILGEIELTTTQQMRRSQRRFTDRLDEIR